MKVGDLVERSLHGSRWDLGIVIEVGSGNDRRVKWFHNPRAYWVSQRNLEVVNESR